jgi:hypothetical protein
MTWVSMPTVPSCSFISLLYVLAGSEVAMPWHTHDNDEVCQGSPASWNWCSKSWRVRQIQSWESELPVNSIVAVSAEDMAFICTASFALKWASFYTDALRPQYCPLVDAYIKNALMASYRPWSDL